ncbi:hypothetical protein Z949_3944 [Sulfitobacter guttiformis KCTC 32187]|uniref:Uncharacterized protein n=1 Tax=Sulfitobacter guttiformis TaxID=74349 RepID=A0A420DSL8_9RHOB|nr:hypothetical protein Z949_3944 [Sulfitobacter guttiformis KCTC 32187]RKE97321.1 hypothetical protein C8N30_1916 [Sulfitobacter guttiformis]
MPDEIFEIYQGSQLRRHCRPVFPFQGIVSHLMVMHPEIFDCLFTCPRQPFLILM